MYEGAFLKEAVSLCLSDSIDWSRTRCWFQGIPWLEKVTLSKPLIFSVMVFPQYELPSQEIAGIPQVVCSGEKLTGSLNVPHILYVVCK